ncbi:hypothetical protein B0H19DRAFT_1375055 [Mycena capillaripes]|nr:hypothetical protein B0H19DRAFT_1375055 [Mycena capillaripes]
MYDAAMSLNLMKKFCECQKYKLLMSNRQTPSRSTESRPCYSPMRSSKSSPSHPPSIRQHARGAVHGQRLSRRRIVRATETRRGDSSCNSHAPPAAMSASAGLAATAGFSNSRHTHHLRPACAPQTPRRGPRAAHPPAKPRTPHRRLGAPQQTQLAGVHKEAAPLRDLQLKLRLGEAHAGHGHGRRALCVRAVDEQARAMRRRTTRAR